MRKFLVLTLAIVLNVLVLPGMARAVFFDDSAGKWWMNQNQWDMFSSFDPAGRTNLQDAHDRLEFNAANGGWTDVYGADRQYISKWAFDTGHDFEFQVNFHYSYVGQRIGDRGSIGMGVMGFENSITDPLQNPNWQEGLTAEDLENLESHLQSAWISAMNSVSAAGLNNNSFYAERGIFSTESDTSWGRNNSEGLFWAHYNAEQDSLKVRAYEQVDSSLYNSGSSTYSGLRDFYNIDKFRVSFLGTSDGAALASGDACLSNFQYISGNMVTPEPISCALFLLGGGALAAARKMRKS